MDSPFRASRLGIVGRMLYWLGRVSARHFRVVQPCRADITASLAVIAWLKALVIRIRPLGEMLGFDYYLLASPSVSHTSVLFDLAHESPRASQKSVKPCQSGAY